MTPLDEAFRALADYRRRELLLALRETDGETEAVTVPEDVVDGGRFIDRLVLQYDHVHLPMLEDRGYVTWERDRDRVTVGPRFDELQPLLEFVETYRDEQEPMTA